MLDDFFTGSLILTSIIAVAFMVERGLALRWKKVVPTPLEQAVDNFNSQADLPLVRAACDQNPSALSRLLLVIINHLRQPRVETVDALETKARHEVALLEKWLVVLEIIVGIAPLLGLVGTVYGLIILFGGLSKNVLGDYAALSRGIGLALHTTLMGLLIAIPSLVAWSYYTKKVETLTVEMETICDEFLRRAYRKSDGAPKPSKSADAKRGDAKP
ncbi:MAG: MotA/TolQ/ExbB proton channel family protein [Verrucomicrobia bacterium]|nr:MotA/TolQ/ExbB proton channel family protein [Verrucomicrobiota bacterium]